MKPPKATHSAFRSSAAQPHPLVGGRLRIGFVSMKDPSDPCALSGMPFFMFRALARCGLDVVDLGRVDSGAMARVAFWGKVRHYLERRIRRLGKRMGWDEATAWRRRPAHMERRLRRLIAQRAAALDAAIARSRPAALVCVCINSTLAELQSDVPIVYSSDATCEVINKTYPNYTALGDRYAAISRSIERQALARIAMAAFACPASLRSAIEVCGLDPDRGCVVGFGAHLVPEAGEDVAIPAPPPSREHLRLSMVAADPVRKRTDLAADATRVLRGRGWNARLTVIGPAVVALDGRDEVEQTGVLSPASPVDRQRHAEIIRASHVCLQPSVGEAYGIAPIESAAFGRPAVVCDVGGLPFVVRDGETGLVVPVYTDAVGLANAIESVAEDVDRYAAMSKAAHARYRDELNWDAWARAVHQRIVDAVAGSLVASDARETSAP